jgi:alpha-beta hydrolase superfamily lysophospholipase
LEGAVIYSCSEERKGPAVLWFHGSGSRAYDLPYIMLGREISARGYTFLTCNTRGHDIFAPLWSESGRATPGCTLMARFGGVPLDLDPWITYAMERGHSGVVLAGHGFGAARVAYYQAHARDPRVAGIILASPDVKWHAEPERVALAERMLADGDGDELMPQEEGSPAWYRMSARTLVERARISGNTFRSGSGVPHIARIEAPILAFYGTEEEWCGGRAELDEIRAAALSSQCVRAALVPGADHVYWGKSAETADLIADWLKSLEARMPVRSYSEGVYAA